MRVMVVEPSRFQQIILKALFNESGFHPDFVQNKQAAIEQSSTKQYQCIFTAYSLPDGTGLDISRHFRGTKNAPGIVLLTAENKRSILHESIASGVTRILRRSDPKELQVFLNDLKDEQVDLTTEPGKILFIEDDRSVATVTEAILRKAGAECTTCAQGEKALEIINEKAFDLVIADYYLDGNLTALDVVQSIRQMGGKSSRTPILILSMQNDPDKRIEILRKGANDYVAKPVIEDELVVRSTNLIIQKKLFDRVEEQRERLRDMAMTDQLTTLYNRHFLVQFAPKRIAEAQRHKSDLSLVVVDLDHFKKVNDTHGHDTGDQVLQETSVILKRMCRKEDMAIRLGGEEFLLLLPHCSLEGVKAKAEQLRSEIELANPAGIKVTASLGATCVEGGKVKDFAEIFSIADEAVYEAKEAGRNRVICKPLN